MGLIEAVFQFKQIFRDYSLNSAESLMMRERSSAFPHRRMTIQLSAQKPDPLSLFISFPLTPVAAT